MWMGRGCPSLASSARHEPGGSIRTPGLVHRGHEGVRARGRKKTGKTMELFRVVRDMGTFERKAGWHTTSSS